MPYGEDQDDQSDNNMTLELPEGEYEFNYRQHLTASILRHVKGWYPRTNLWQSLPFRIQLGNGEPNAACCAIWAIKRLEGITPNPEPTRLATKLGDPSDFPIGKVR